MKKPFVILLTSILLVLAVGEAFARFALGLGTPPLSISHDSIEYMFAPNQDVQRFGNLFVTNDYGMRSPSLKTIGDRTFVLVVGDSVVNGGNLTDHADLATTLATNPLAFFGNASAGSWGIPNFAAWIDSYGFLGSTILVVVNNSGDAYDVPTFGSLNPSTHPTQKPMSALLEAVTRYLPRYLPDLKPEQPVSEQPAEPGMQSEVQIAIDEIAARAASERVKVCVIHHWSASEIHDGKLKAGVALSDAWRAKNIPVLDDLDLMDLSSEEGTYRDNIHLNERGQMELTHLLKRCSEEAQFPQG